MLQRVTPTYRRPRDPVEKKPREKSSLSSCYPGQKRLLGLEIQCELKDKKDATAEIIISFQKSVATVHPLTSVAHPLDIAPFCQPKDHLRPREIFFQQPPKCTTKAIHRNLSSFHPFLPRNRIMEAILHQILRIRSIANSAITEFLQ